ncbi:type VI secretion system baseplate subunit TssE [Herbaspirillum sp. RTI4]|uniref:type VI secretion system baseplate subunit TssE n=1 Tax=Herbaspirillum sp. RTI4 TaxID=3048640 RepID=UPI002AB3B28B|nr:type VI secretion system baseplate subunit TssE [Herbaspirillum sp. RTI4]MDY7579027.1 type VI secretion system baseplate subunit TssE [Herbaspirillum sp. RTI4]MEA9980958.1 type VI secretion system baseplate subunit TssE [Herbaspirillum sp. RTI4]
MKGFTPGLFDRLMSQHSVSNASETISIFSMDLLKDAVARDLEAMLNTRTVIEADLLGKFDECCQSILTYGLSDFAGLSLASVRDRRLICESLEKGIARHEPRLQNVNASLELRDGSINRLNFVISARLVVHPAQELVSFDAVLQPSSLQYSIGRMRRNSRTEA